jgi:hypothetical protein
MTMRLLPASFALLLISSPAFAGVDDLWKAADTAPIPDKVYAIEVGRFPSEALAASVAGTLTAMNWGPVRTIEVDGRRSVIVGESPDIVEIHSILEELTVQKLADGRVILVPDGERDREALPFRGPLLPAFHSLGNPEPNTADLAVRMRATSAAIMVDERNAMNAAIDLMDAGTFDDPALGDSITPALLRIRDDGSAADLILPAAERIARGEWAASPRWRLAAMELCADLYLGARRDIRSALHATQALLDEPQRTPEGRARDLLRLEALNGLVLAKGAEPFPSFTRMRSQLRLVYEQTPEGEVKTRARTALLTLQTFAWEGNWERVIEFGEEFLSEFGNDPAVFQVGAVLVARGYETVENYKRAIIILDQAIAAKVARSERFRVGDQLVNAREMASQWQAYFRALESGVDRPARPAEIIFDEARVTIAEDSQVDQGG